MEIDRGITIKRYYQKKKKMYYDFDSKELCNGLRDLSVNW